MSESLNLPIGHAYHTGIRRDESNYQVWRRISDGAAVQLEGWFPGHPDVSDMASHGFLYWDFYDNSYKNMILSWPHSSRPFICEY